MISGLMISGLCVKVLALAAGRRQQLHPSEQHVESAVERTHHAFDRAVLLGLVEHYLEAEYMRLHIDEHLVAALVLIANVTLGDRIPRPLHMRVTAVHPEGARATQKLLRRRLETTAINNIQTTTWNHTLATHIYIRETPSSQSTIEGSQKLIAA